MLFLAKLIRPLIIVTAILSAKPALASAIEGHGRHRPPLIIVVENHISGILVDIADEAARRDGHRIHWREIPFKRSLAALKDGQEVLVPRMSITTERLEYTIFSPSVAQRNKEVRFLHVPGGLPPVRRYEDLKAFRIGILRGSNYFPRFNQDHSLVKILGQDSFQLARMLKMGRIDLLASIDERATLQAMERAGIREWDIVSYSWREELEVHYGMQRNSPLSPSFFSALEKMSHDGSIPGIYRRYGLEHPGF